MIRLLWRLAVVCALWGGFSHSAHAEAWPWETTAVPDVKDDRATAVDEANALIKDAFEHGRSNFWVRGQGVVERVLKDDVQGSRHQRFILRLSNGHTVLIAHNIDIAQRIADLKTGDTVEFFGEYEWNAKGGVIHWTHHDPTGRRPGGWLKRQGRRFE